MNANALERDWAARRTVVTSRGLSHVASPDSYNLLLNRMLGSSNPVELSRQRRGVDETSWPAGRAADCWPRDLSQLHCSRVQDQGRFSNRHLSGSRIRACSTRSTRSPTTILRMPRWLSRPRMVTELRWRHWLCDSKRGSSPGSRSCVRSSSAGIGSLPPLRPLSRPVDLCSIHVV